MSGRVPCGSCGRPMSSMAVRCPHCAAFQARSPGKPAATKRSDPPAAPPPLRALQVSPDEARALLAVSAVTAGDDVETATDEPGVFEGMVLPHPRSSGGMRAAEIALTALAAPLVALSLLSLAMLSLRAARFGGVRGRPAAFRGAGVVTGALALGSFLFAAELSAPVVAGIVAMQLGALLARAALRTAAKRRRSAAYDLTR